MRELRRVLSSATRQGGPDNLHVLLPREGAPAAARASADERPGVFRADANAQKRGAFPPGRAQTALVCDHFANVKLLPEPLELRMPPSQRGFRVLEHGGDEGPPTCVGDADGSKKSQVPGAQLPAQFGLQKSLGRAVEVHRATDERPTGVGPRRARNTIHTAEII